MRSYEIELSHHPEYYEEALRQVADYDHYLNNDIKELLDDLIHALHRADYA